MPKLSTPADYSDKQEPFTIARKLKELRAKSCKSQEEAAKRIGVTRSSLGAYEEGRAIPPLEILMLICKFYKISMDEMVGWENPKTVKETKLSDIELAYKQASPDKRDIVDYILRIGMHSVI